MLLAHLDWEFQLIIHLRDQQVVAQSLPHLHNPHNGRIYLVLPVLEDTFSGAGLLLHLQKWHNL